MWTSSSAGGGMRSAVGFVRQFLGMSLLGAMSVATLPSYPCANLCERMQLQCSLIRPFRSKTVQKTFFAG